VTAGQEPSLLEIVCPLCGGIVESGDVDELVETAAEHCLQSHGYQLPREHALAAVHPVE
jgi:hypothetical protein